VVLALVIFGGSRLSGVGKALGTSIREFKQEVKAADDDDKKKEEEKAENSDGKDA
jgi:sec-independent protein translocase protein TatA